MAIKLQEYEYLLQLAAARRDWLSLAQEILTSTSLGHGDHASKEGRRDHEEVVADVSDLLQVLDQKQFPVEYIRAWMILVLRWILEPSCNSDEEKCSLEARSEEASTYNSDGSAADAHEPLPLQIDVEYLRKELCIFDNDIQIGLVRLVNIILVFDSFTKDSNEDLDMNAEDESTEQAHIILEILNSQPEAKDGVHQRTSFDNLVQNESISLFWNQIIGISKNDSYQILSPTPSLNSASSYPSYPPSSIWSPEDIPKIIDTGDIISGHIVTAAQFAKAGLERYVVPTVTKGIEAVGDIVIHNTEPVAKPNPSSMWDDGQLDEEEQMNEKDMKEVVSISDKSVETTDAIRRGARSVAFGVRDFSTRQVQNATTVWKEREVGKQIIPDDGVRETIVATGKVGVATLGAAALLTETLFKTTKAIAQTSVKVASDVANHKYGEDTGKLVQNTGDTTGNVLSAITHVGMLEAQVMTKVIAQNTAKEELVGDCDDEKDPVLILKDMVKNKLEISKVTNDQENTIGNVTSDSLHPIEQNVESDAEIKKELAIL